MHSLQNGILAPVPAASRYLFFSLDSGADARPALASLAEAADGLDMVVGLGEPLVRALGCEIPGLRTFPAMSGPGVAIPSTPSSLWCWLRGEDRGELLHRGRRVVSLLDEAFGLDQAIEAFRYADSRDLSGYEDGTENPEDEEAIAAAMVRDAGPGLDGSSFLAVQQWVHDLDAFQAKTPEEQDQTIGRRISDNEEIEDAPASAHVKRTAQESFQPEAFVLRRSMPWSDGVEEGLVFTAFGHSFDAFEALLRRMVGAEDGVTDALFTFTRPVTGGYFWCPPLTEGKLDLSIL